MAEFHNPLSISSGRTQENYNYRHPQLIGTNGYTNAGCNCEHDVPTDNSIVIINQVVDALKKDGVFDNIVVDENKIADSVVKYLQTNNMLNVDTDIIVSTVCNDIKNDIVFIESLKGPKGDPGADGKDGISPTVSEIVTELKSDTSFVDSIKGDKGDQGEPGPKGDSGEDGKDGEPGKDGQDGVNGIDGQPGKDADPEEVANILKADEDFIAACKGDKGDPGDPGTGDNISLSISEEEGNIIIEKEDGLFVPETDIDTVIEGLNDKNYLEGQATEEFVTEAIENHTTEMKDEIRAGYQKILDEDINYITWTYKVGNNTAGPILTFNLEPWCIVNNGFTIDEDGYIELKKDHLYTIMPSIMLGGSSNNVGYYIIDKTGNTIKDMSYYSEISTYSDFQVPITFMPEEDIAIALKLNKASTIYAYGINIIENKQSVYTNIDINNFLKQIGENNQDAPVGNVISYMGNEAPAHYLPCDGSIYNIEDYKYLTEHFIEAFGSVDYFGGDGITTFAVPDLRGEFLRGTGENSHTNTLLDIKEGDGATVGQHQEATVKAASWSGTTGFIFPYDSNTKIDSISADTCKISSRSMSDSFVNTDYPNGMSGLYTSRPTNTSVLFCIKYEPTYFLNIGDATIGVNIEEVVSRLKQDGYIAEVVVPTKEEVIDNLINVLEKSGYLNESLEGNQIIEKAILRMIDNGDITPDADEDSDPVAYNDFIGLKQQEVYAVIGEGKEATLYISELIDNLVRYSILVIEDDEVFIDQLIEEFISEGYIDFVDPVKKSAIKDFLMNSAIFDDTVEDQDTTIPIAIQALKDANLLGEKINITEVTETVSSNLKDSGFLNGYAKESYVDKAAKDTYNKAIEDMKNNIRDGYQHILDEDIGYLTLSKVPPDTNRGFAINSVLTFSDSNIVSGNGKIKIDNEGYVELKAGKLYSITSCVMIKTASGYSNDIGYKLIDKSGNIVGSNKWAEIGSYSDMIIPDIIMPEEDCAVAIMLVAKATVYQYDIAVYEIKQPVITNVKVSSYMDQVGPDSQDTPVGNIISFMGNNAPKHYLICDGSEYNITEYPELANHFIKEFGSVDYFGGDGVTTFAVPDLRGEFLRGTGENSHKNQGGGANVGEHQDGTKHANVFPANNTSLYAYKASVSSNNSVIEPDFKINATNQTILAGSNSTVSNSTTAQYTSRPTNTAVMYCIKYEATYAVHFDDASIYSEEERVVGKWIDGKVLYRKVVNLGPGFLAKNDNRVKIFDKDTIDTVFIEKAYIKLTTNIIQQIPYISTNGIENNVSVLIDKDYDDTYGTCIRSIIQRIRDTTNQATVTIFFDYTKK